MLIGTGTGHFLVPKPFDTIVPAELPGSPRTYTYLSGIAEIATGALLSLPGTPPIWRACGRCPIYRRLSGERQHGAAVVAEGWPMRIVALARLPLQIPMIVAALTVRRNA